MALDGFNVCLEPGITRAVHFWALDACGCNDTELDPLLYYPTPPLADK